MSDGHVCTMVNGTFGLGRFAGKRIETVRMVGNALHIVLDDNTGLRFEDQAQACCEDRWMTCDDDLSGWTGARIVAARIADAPSGANGEDVQFLRIETDRGDIVCATHNDHNGYYGGLDVVVSEVPT